MWTKALDTQMLSVRTLNVFCENLHRIEGLAFSSFATAQNEENMQDTTEPTETDLQSLSMFICRLEGIYRYVL